MSRSLPITLFLSSVCLCAGCDKLGGNAQTDRNAHASRSPADGVDPTTTFVRSTDPAVELHNVSVDVGEDASVTIEFSAKRIKEPGENAKIHVKAACQVGDDVLVDAITVFAWPDQWDDGASKQLESALFTSAGLPGSPSLCEFRFFFKRLMREPELLKDLCWTGGSSIDDGRCTGLERQKSSERIEVVSVNGQLETRAYGDDDKKSLRTNYTILFGGPMPADDLIHAKIACTVNDDEKVEEHFPAEWLGYMASGEKMALSSSFFTAEGVDSSASCDFIVELQNRFTAEAKVFGEFCFADGTMSEGTCG
ncbi:MAG: hypothetical protein AAGA54_16030 [Myxococcota bacterium]